MKKIITAFIIVLNISSVTLSQNSINDYIIHPYLDGASFGVLLKDVKSDSILFSYNDNNRLTTASNLKLFTSAAAIELLGANYKFVTRFYTSGAISANGVLDGDLLIEGGGDPLISGRFRDSITEVLVLWSDSLKAKGIKKIKGNLVVDNNWFESDVLGPSWSYDYLSYWYACPISPLSLNDNCVDFHAYPGEKEGDTCRIVFKPENDYIEVINNTTTLPAGLNNTLDFYRRPETNTIEFFGGIDINDKNGMVDYVSVHQPHMYCASVFRDILESRGITVDGIVVDINKRDLSPKYQYSNLTPLFDWKSLPMSEVAKVINKNSQNFFAEQTLKTIGAELAGEGSFARSTEIVSDWLKSIGIPGDDVSYNDGSGLAHMNLATPASIVYLLEYMYKSENFDIYYESLAIPGKDRSVRGRMEGQPLAEYMRTKTGTIANTRTFSGYLTTGQGRLVAFSIMINNYSSSRDEIDRWTDSLCGYIIDTY